MSILDWTRWVTIVLSVVGVGIGVVELVRIWTQVTPDVRLRRMATLGLVAAAGYGTAEAMWIGIPPGPRTFVTAVVVFWAASAYLTPPRNQMIPAFRRQSKEKS